jgi:cyclophilin family peptidyl-prolyl cis-trans isomerase
MGNIKHIAIVLVLSIALIGLIGWWVQSKSVAPEVILENAETLDGPLTPKELTTNNPQVTNTMNRTAVFNTNKGVIKIELFEDKMPITTGNFIKLAEEGFYNGIKFHRVIDGFMIQAGDPNTKGDDISIYGQGGPKNTIKDEFVSDPLLTNVRGTIAMANTGQPDSGGSQFFINTGDNTSLDFGDDAAPRSNHPVFGRVIDGMDVVDAIGAVQTTKQPPVDVDRPIEPIIIESLTIE